MYQVSWPDIETCEAKSPDPQGQCFGGGSNFGPLTTELVDLHNASPSIDNVTVTLSRTPKWADQNTNQQTDPSCNFFDKNDSNNTYGGACYAPTGFGSECSKQGQCHLNQDGTGDDQIWLYWVAAIAKWVNTPSLCQDSHGNPCAHVKYWEIWNEFNRDDTSNGKASWYAKLNSQGNCVGFSPCPTPDQLIRMTEDARCVITGQGTIDNYMKPGDQPSCFSLQANHTYPGPFDSSAQIVQPSITAPSDKAGPPVLEALKCYLYCDSTSCGTWFGGACRSQ